MTNDGRLTVGSNTDAPPVTANHYLVFVSAPPWQARPVAAHPLSRWPRTR